MLSNKINGNLAFATQKPTCRCPDLKIFCCMRNPIKQGGLSTLHACTCLKCRRPPSRFRSKSLCINSLKTTHHHPNFFYLNSWKVRERLNSSCHLRGKSLPWVNATSELATQKEWVAALQLGSAMRVQTLGRQYTSCQLLVRRQARKRESETDRDRERWRVSGGGGVFLGTREDGDTNLRQCNNAFIQACLLLPPPPPKKKGGGEAPVLNVSSASQATPPAPPPPPQKKKHTQKKRGRVVP